MATCHPPGIPDEFAGKSSNTSGPSSSSGRNMVWNFSSSVFMIIGDADTPWHPQFFSAATFESQRLTQDGTTLDPSHGLRLEEDPVAHFVILPIYQEDETLQRETLESWLLFFGRETQTYCDGDGPSRGGNWPPPSRTRWPTIIRLEFWTCL